MSDNPQGHKPEQPQHSVEDEATIVSEALEDRLDTMPEFALPPGEAEGHDNALVESDPPADTVMDPLDAAAAHPEAPVEPAADIAAELHAQAHEPVHVAPEVGHAAFVSRVRAASSSTADTVAADDGGLFSRLAKKVRRLGPLFFLTIVFPMMAAILYFGFLASNVYVSESRFVVRSPDKPAASGLGGLLKSAGFSNAGDEIYAAEDYVKSRDALKALNNNQKFFLAYSRADISLFDRFNPLHWDGSFEDLYKYYVKKVEVNRDGTSSITTLTVRAYTPEDARRFNEQLLEMVEATVNELNKRGRQDLIHFAQVEVDSAKASAREAALALSTYRNRQGVVDPEKQASVQLQMISKLQDELIATRNQLRQLRAFAPDNPQIEVLDARAKGLGGEIADQLGKVAGDQTSLSSTAAQYQRLVLESQFADKALAGALSSLEDANNEARRKQAYVERIVQPNLPDDPLEPRRMRGILATLVLGIVAYGVLSMLLAGIMEHRD